MSTNDTSPREKFQNLLKKLFQFDSAELDFGIYRIMNQKRAVIQRFIEKDLLDGVTKELASGTLAEEAGLTQELAEVTTQIKKNIGDEALDADGNLATEYHGSKLGKRYLALRQRAGSAKSNQEQEAEIFNRLYTFFSRYYDEGDFMSLRRYSKRDKYAIPYNGEDVYLHWANADQYYIKTLENFTDYTYNYGGWKVHFNLRKADVEQDNIKGAKRFFLPRVADVALDSEARELTIPFEYRQLTKQEAVTFKSKPQDTILAESAPKIASAAKSNPDALAALLHEKLEDADGNPVSLLYHHLRIYTRKNSSDFFIHKDLKRFLERELDFYLKHEVLNLDELDAGGEPRSAGWFQTLHTIKSIGRKIIAFLAQLENFQRRLFEKKKFITEVQYCVTLDRVPEDLYPEIAKNKAQIAEWKRLFYIHEIKRDATGPRFREPVQTSFLKANPFLVLDTTFFPPQFTEKLLASKSFLHGAKTLDDALDGLLVHGDNFHVNRILSQRFRQTVQCLYIDPPYNSDASPILYKNGYKDSSWMTLVRDRLVAAVPTLKQDATIAVAIDDTQQRELSFLLSQIFSGRMLGTFCVRSNPSGRPTQTGYSVAHDYVLYAGNSSQAVIGRMAPTPEQMARFSETDELGAFEWRNLRREGSNSDRAARRYLYYPIYITPTAIRVPPLVWDDQKDEWIPQKPPLKNETVIYPDNDQGIQKTWRWGHETVTQSLESLSVRKDRNKRDYVYYKRRPHEDGVVSVSAWFDAKYSATEHGTALLKDIFGISPFSYPKSLFAVMDSIYISGASNPSALVFDFFAGSGTTAHAVIELNRQDRGHRKYILVEMEEYFDTVLKPRLQRVIYSHDWKDGKPVSRQGTSHAFKYLRLESYEDALDNITFHAADKQVLFQLEDYVLSYMLDFDTKESQTLLNVEKLDAPFDYKLHLHGRDEPLPVDLPETFNYLIGLHVESRHVLENNGVRYLVYSGRAEGRATVILWRPTRGWKQTEFEADRDFVAKHKLTEGMEDIFVNTDSFIPNARSLDPVFKRSMFNEE